jgi:small subunit ribosomal protein S20
MANHKSAKTRIKRNATANKVNAARKSAVRTAVKKVELAIAAGDAKAAKAALVDARPSMQRSAAKGVFDKKATSRKMSRLSIRIKKLDAKA